MALAATEVTVLEAELAKHTLEGKQPALTIVTTEDPDRMHTLDISIKELQRLISEKTSAIQSAKGAEAARIVDEKRAREALEAARRERRALAAEDGRRGSGSGRKRAKCEHSRVKSTCEECKAIISNEQTKRAADAVVAANLVQFEALARQLAATRVRLAIEDVGARRGAYGLYAVELQDLLSQCFSRVQQAQGVILAPLPPIAAASNPCPAAEQVAVIKLEDGAPAPAPPPAPPPPPPPARAQFELEDAVVAANLVQIKALTRQLEAIRACLAIEDSDVGATLEDLTEADIRYAGELEDQLSQCLDRVQQAQSAILALVSPQGAASSPCRVKAEPGAAVAAAAPPARAQFELEDAVVAANLAQVKAALTRQLEAIRARLAIEDSDVGATLEDLTEADRRYAGELEDQLSQCLDRVQQAQSVILAPLPPIAAASNPCRVKVEVVAQVGLLATLLLCTTCHAVSCHPRDLDRCDRED